MESGRRGVTKLLICTQAVDRNDPVLGFFHQWIEAFAERCEAVTVICLREGAHDLPTNVSVHALGNFQFSIFNFQIFRKIIRAVRFWRLAWRLRREYDAVFVHMNPEYVALCGALWRLSGKRVVLWYTHRQVNLRLRIAVLLSHAVATAAPESLRIGSPKVHVVGHGVDTAAFAAPRDGHLHDPVAIVSAGRITPIKRLGLLIEAFAALRKETAARLTLVGAPVYPSDEEYQKKLQERVRELGIEDAVEFRGSVPNAAMPELYRAQDISINLAPTGGIDKAVLESMASGCITLAANRAFLPHFGADADTLLFDPEPRALARHVRTIVSMPQAERVALSARLARAARERADLSAAIGRIIDLCA